MRGRIRFGMGLTAVLCLLPAVQAADLLDVYQRAQQSDPLVREAENNRLATREARPRALSGLLPQIDASGNYQDSSAEGSSVFPTGDPPVIATRDSESETETTSWQLQLTQSVFRWDRFVTLKQANSQVAQAEADYQAAQQDLILRVSTRYFDVLAARDTLQAQTTARDAIARQLEQAEKRFEVGLIAITDVQEAKAAHDNASAAVIAAKRALATAQELLRELTGDFIEVDAAPGSGMPLKSPEPQNEDAWVATAMEQNLALISSRLAAEIARDTISIRRSGHLPTLDVILRRQDFDQTGADTGFPADADGTDDQVILALNFPIYSGGLTQSNVREAIYRHRAARERLERTSRETERAARDAFLGVISEISRVQALRQALESSRTALQATEAGYEVGTRTTVDVLDARRTLAQAETNYARSRYDYIINIIRLKLAAGTLSSDDVKDINSWLEPVPPTPAKPVEMPPQQQPTPSQPPPNPAPPQQG
jgi:outer membrane protein